MNYSNYSYESISLLEIEISTYCNAACPQCPRNVYGGKTVPDLPLINWSTDQFIDIIKKDFIQQLKVIYFCGTYGDPLMNSSLVEMCHYLKAVNPNIKIGIHTNGGAGKSETFQQLAKLVNFIAFGIDGLDDTNHLYRRNTSWETILNNAQSYIDAGGYAVWDFIVFKHNQHQVETAKELSQKLGFKEFNIKKTGRFFNKAHELINKVDVQDKNNNFLYSIEPPSINLYKNTGYELIKVKNLSKYIASTKIDCYFMKNNMVYIGADGYVFPCGFLHDRLYGIEVKRSSDYTKIKKLMDDVGGNLFTNVFFNSIKNIIDGPWFAAIKSSWDSESRLERCAITCGETINLVGQQNINIKYKQG